MTAAISSHLLQSTLFLALAALLTWNLRHQHARIRYWVWMVASAKFLVPFALLINLGKQFTSIFGFDTVSVRGFSVAIKVIANTAPVIASPLARQLRWLTAAWLVGTVAVAAFRCLRWRKAARDIQRATPAYEGRELELLRRIESNLGVGRPMKVVRSTAASEPGVFGILRPVLLWPEGVSEHLTDLELAAILTHEVRHVQRKDNLTAAIHMIVEALFWFHPLVWWLGARLVAERERACDEDVLALGSTPRAYAGSILKVCEFCLRSPLVCMSGVAGGDLRKRMVLIMKNRELKELGFYRKLALGTIALACIAGPLAIGLVHASEPPTEPVAALASRKQSVDRSPVLASKHEMMDLVVKKVPPVYPPAARKAHIQGEVILRATVGKKGNVENLQVVSGPSELSPAAIDAVKQWRYRPYVKNGQAVEVQTDISVNFTLVE